MSNEHERFKRMIESSQDWFWEFDEHANFTYASPRIKDLLGYDPEEVIGQNAFDLMSDEEAKRVRQHFDPIAQKYLPFNYLENINIHRDGYEVIMESSGTPIFDEQGRFRGYRGIDRDVTLRKKTEADLHEREVKFQQIVDTSSEWIWEMDLLGRHTYSNDRLVEVLGYSLEEFVGVECTKFLHTDDLQKVNETLPQLISEKRGWSGWVLRWLHKDGSYRYLESNAKPIINSAGEIAGYSGADRDVTQRKSYEDAMALSQEMLTQTQQLAKVGSWQFNLVSNKLSWSEETYRIFGVDAKTFEPTYESFLEKVYPEDRAKVDKAFSASLLKGADSYEVEHRILKEGTGELRYLYEKCQNERDLTGAVVRSIGMVQDITDRKAYEEALFIATQAAESADKAKGMFLAQVSHELRTPMTAIVGFGELLENAKLTSEERKYLAALNTSSKVLSSIIEDILDLSKVEAGVLTIKSNPFSLRNLISKVVAMHEQQIAEKGLLLTVNIKEDVPDAFVGDSLRIKQVLLNLLGNAVKFTEKGSVKIDIAAAEESRSRVLLVISVKDTGVGIPEELQGSIFEPFVQGAEHSHRGAGLGLTISRSLAGLMGGTIRLDSHLGIGSTFQFLLPLKSEDEKSAKKILKKDESIEWRCPALKILLVEDNSINSQFMKAVLENMGHVVTHAGNGKIALDALKVNSFELVLMDIEMPVMNGIDALRAIRHLEKTGRKALNVIAMTAYALVGDHEKYLKMGFDGYLSKPFLTKDLVDELQRVVSGSPHQSLNSMPGSFTR